MDFSHQIVALPAALALVGLGAQRIVERAYVAWGRERRWLLNTAVTGGAAILAGLTLWVTVDSVFDRWARLPAVHRLTTGVSANSRFTSTGTPTGRRPRSAPSALNRSPSVRTAWTARHFRGSLSAGMDDAPPTDELRYGNCVSGLVLTRGGEPQRFAFADPAGPTGARRATTRLVGWCTTCACAGPTARNGVERQRAAGCRGYLRANDSELRSTMRRRPSGHRIAPCCPSAWAVILPSRAMSLSRKGHSSPGDAFTLVTYWRADGTQVPGLGFFAHVMRNPYTAPILQNDILSIDELLLAQPGRLHPARADHHS